MAVSDLEEGAVMEYIQQSLFISLLPELPKPKVYVPEKFYDYESEANAFRELGGVFADNQLGTVVIDLGDDIIQKFRFIYNPNAFGVGRWCGPRVEIFGVFGYRDLKREVSHPNGLTFDEWIRKIIEPEIHETAARFAVHDLRIFHQSAGRLKLTPKDIKKRLSGDDAAKITVRDLDETPITIMEINYKQTEYRSHYEISDSDIYTGKSVYIN